MSSTRTSRASTSRAAEEIHESHEEFDDIDFSPANLTAPPPREGYVQRWVRTKVGNEDDQSNVYRSTNLGWKPRAADTVPKESMVQTVDFKGSNIIGVNDTILMERPIAIDIKHKAYEKRLSDNQIEAVKQDVHSVHTKGSGLTRPEYSSTSSVSKGRVAPVTPDQLT